MKCAPVPYEKAKALYSDYKAKKPVNCDLSYPTYDFHILTEKATGRVYAEITRKSDGRIMQHGSMNVKDVRLTSTSLFIKLPFKTYEFPLMAPSARIDPVAEPHPEEKIEPDLLIKGLESVLLAKVRNCSDMGDAHKYTKAYEHLMELKAELE